MESEHTEPMQSPRPKAADFKDSNEIDPTAGWIPFALIIAVVPLFLIVIIVGYLIIIG